MLHSTVLRMFHSTSRMAKIARLSWDNLTVYEQVCIMLFTVKTPNLYSVSGFSSDILRRRFIINFSTKETLKFIIIDYLLIAICFELMPQTYNVDTTQLIAFQFNLIKDGKISSSRVRPLKCKQRIQQRRKIFFVNLSLLVDIWAFGYACFV